MNSHVVCLLLLIPDVLLQFDEAGNSPDVAEQLYIKLYKRKRVEQLEAVKKLQKLEKYEKQYDMITLMAEKIFTLMQESRATLEASSYIPGVSEFPQDENVKNALSSILENTALYCDVVLRFPEISSAVLKTNNNWDILLQWSIAFCHQVKHLLDKSSVKLLHLASQELRHVERDENYTNPYRKVKKLESVDGTAQVQRVKRKKKEIKKGPRLNVRTEL